MEIIKTCLQSWPAVALVFGVIALMLFRKPALAFLDRTHEVGVGNVRLSARPPERQQAEAPPDLSKTEKLASTFQSPVLIETEQFILKELNAESNLPAEREKILVKHLAALGIALSFERTYRIIFGSQISLLNLLATVPPQGIENVRPFYEQAKSKDAGLYGQFTFVQWLGFLEESALVTKQAEKITITVRGKEFLKYLIDAGYTTAKPN